MAGYCPDSPYRYNLEDRGIDGWMICKVDLEELEYEVVVWIKLVQVRNQWWAVVNAVINFRFP